MDDLRQDILETLSMARRYVRQRAEMGEREFCVRASGRLAGGGSSDPAEALRVFGESVAGCEKCRLAQGRTRVVFGSGDPEAGLMFVGEGPGRDEDERGEPFVGAAGQLLTRILSAAKLRREDVYIANIVKCRPPNNRDPMPDEIATCLPYLQRQIEIVRPKVICALGKVAAQTLLQSDEPIGKLRGRVHRYGEIKLIATYHPAALLRNAALKRPTWEDMKMVRKEYDGVEL
jgi:DNA polymerase